MKGTAATGAALAFAVATLAGGCTPTQVQASPSVTGHAPSPTASATPNPSVTPTLAWGPTVADWQQALADAQALPLDQAAGQVVMARVSSPTPSVAARLVKTNHLAGVILMDDAVQGRAEVQALTAAIAGADPGRPAPVMIATDEEGGTVQRLQDELGYVSAFMAAGANGDAPQVRDYYSALGGQMAQLGFTMDMAPDADVTVGSADPTIRTRSAGSDPAVVSSVVNAAWGGIASAGVTPVIKHFPGHGSVKADSHKTLPVQSATVAQLADRDFVPFANAIADGVPVIMVGHIEVSEWGALPTSVNPLTYTYLRGDLGFTGLLMTDAMDMAAVTDQYPAETGSIAALAAGVDLVLMPRDPVAAVATISAAVTAGTLPRARLDDAAAHVILAARWQAQLAGAAGAAATERPREFVEDSIVVASEHCDALVGPSVRISGGTAAQRTALAAALTAEGIHVGTKGTHIALVGGDTGHADSTVVVATGGPWGLPASTADTYVATWGGGDEQMAALAKVLAGSIPPRGSWPVSVKLPYGVCS